MTVSVIQVVAGTKVASDAATVTATLSNGIVAGDVVVALIANNGANGNHTVAGLGATWTRVGKDSLALLDMWVGIGATATGTVTATQTTAAAVGFKYLNLWHVRGTTTAWTGGADNATGDTLTSTAMTAGAEQIFIGSGYAETSANSFSNPSPATGWVNSGDLVMTTSRQASRVHRIPTTSQSHQFSTVRTGSTAHPLVRVVLGTRANVINSSFSGSGTVSTTVEGGSLRTAFEARGKTGAWSSLAEGDAFLDALDARHTNVTVTSVGTGSGGQPMRLVRIGPAANTHHVLYVAQQHGFEVAGRDALFSKLRDWAESEDPDVLAYLSTTTILAIPTAHPNNFTDRDNANGANLNWDHLELVQPETQAIHTVIRDYRPSLVIDMHEGSQASDVGTSYAVNQNTDSEIRAHSLSLHNAVGTALVAAGDTHELYADPAQLRGPEYLTENAGLSHAVPLLVESRYANTSAERHTSYQTTLDAITDWHDANKAAVAASISGAKTRAAARTTSFDLVFQYGPTGTILDPVPASYRLTAAQHTAISFHRDRFNVTSVPDGADYLVSVGQESQPIIPYLLDGRSLRSPVDATAIYPAAEKGVIGVYKGAPVPIGNATATVALTAEVLAGDVIIALVAANATNSHNHTVSGLGATWTKLAEDSAFHALALWKGVGATSSGTVTATLTSGGAVASTNKAVGLWHLRNIAPTSVAQAMDATGDTLTSADAAAGNGQVVIGAGYSNTATDAFKDPAPADWTVSPAIDIYNAERFASMAHREVEGDTANHHFSTYRAGSTAHPLVQAVMGDIAPQDINAAFTGAGALGTALTGFRELSPAFSGTGTLSTTGLGIAINSAFTGEGTLSTPGAVIASDFTGFGQLDTQWSHYLEMPSGFSGEGIMLTDLVYDLPPAPLDKAPLKQLSGYSVASSAVPLNPAEGSGSVPAVNPSYIAGTDPEFVLGQVVEVKNNSIGAYSGEAVKVTVNKGSDVVALSTNTLMTQANKDLRLSPFIDDSPGTWTAARAIDYWTQQAGIFYDAVPGACAFYASGYGHTLAYARENDGRRCYEKATGGSTAQILLNNRSVRTFGDNVTATTAMHDSPEARVPVVFALRQKLVFSLGIGLRGSSRTASASASLVDGLGKVHTLKIAATSAGTITASLGTLTLGTASVAAGGNYRVTVSVERASASSLAVRLTVHTDDLAGAGTLAHNGSTKAVTYPLPGVLHLTSVVHASAGDTGSAMLRWGTYLTLATDHPTTVPAVQKNLAQTAKTHSFVSGFEGNVWKMMAEFCSIARLDVRFHDGQLVVEPRSSAVVSTGLNFSRLTKDSSRREKFKQVAVVNRQSKAVATNNAVLWRADSVYQLNVREVFETTVQTEHSILSVVNPVPVPGITPYPYTTGGGQYVVTGADGYIIAPQWWADHGGKVEVFLTEREGEIRLKITAPDVDSVRAPYRISEGADDRPALYVSGSGIINDPKELHIATGATNAREGFDTVFESPFISGTREAFDVASKMAREYSAAMAEVDMEVPTDFDTPSAFGQYPAGAVFTDNDRNYRLAEVTQTHSRVSARAEPHTTIKAYKASYPAGATIADEKARHAGRSIREFNIKPLRSS